MKFRTLHLTSETALLAADGHKEATSQHRSIDSGVVLGASTVTISLLVLRFSPGQRVLQIPAEFKQRVRRRWWAKKAGP